MNNLKIYHNPRCSKSRKTLKIIKDHGIEPTVVEYLKKPLEKSELENIFRLLNKRPKDLIRRNENEFKENNIKRTGNWKLWLKTIVMFSIFLVPYFLILTIDMPGWLQILFTIVMGVGMAGVGTNVMHDGNHGSFSKYPWVNKFMGSSIYFLAGNVFNWKIQHNLLHHTYTNIHGHDEDLEAGRVLRFSKHSEWFPHHRFQHFYSVLLYGLLTLNWAVFADFQQMKRYTKRKLSYLNSKKPSLQWVGLFLTKIMYFSIWIVVPIFIIDAPWWTVLIGFVVMHYTAGLILSLVFQLAHVMPEMEFPKENSKNMIENNWTIHQLETTANFSQKSRLFSWYIGGLNYQIENLLRFFAFQ